MSLATSYDEVPYPRLAFPLSHPSHLATIGRLLGMQPIAVDQCRVLELGCASGSNLVPMAYALPRSQFVGVDLSARQIADGKEFAAAIGLTNIDFLQLDIRAAAERLRAAGPFDYIIAHGIYSWVPDQVKDALLAAVRRLLAPDGIAYVSYNCYPGCQARDMLRQMCQYHGRKSSGSREYAAETRKFLEFFQKALGGGDGAYRATVRQQIGDLLQVPDEVLLHDDLEGDNDPRFFHQFMSHAAQHGLQYLGDAYFGQMFGAGIKPAALEKIRHAGDRLAFEQYLDFLYGRSLRTTLLCHQAVKVNGEIVPDGVRGLWIASDGKPVDGDGKPLELGKIRMASTDPLTFRGDECTLRVTTRLGRAALMELASAAPKPILFETLLERVQHHLATSQAKYSIDSLGHGNAHALEAAAKLSDMLIEWFAMRLIELRAYCPPLAAQAGGRPQASAVSRHQASLGWWRVTNLLHRRIRLDGEFANRVIGMLDGRHDRSAIIEALVEPVAAGKVAARFAGKPLTNPRQIRPILAEQVEACLNDFVRHGLLVEAT
ncbi:MAG TPA: class I SAM-dependent methyltransferase [Pirellulales bacterium]|nr:class I SAM-dependent methyltransferase [Pirellulales bacterium]